MGNVDSSFAKWESMKDFRDNRIVATKHIQKIKQHQDKWPLYQYSHERYSIKVRA
jgi:hypothetical protein